MYNENDFCDPDSGFDYIFARMAAIYGGQFQRHWADSDPMLIRQTWKDLLGKFLTYRPSMDYAISHLDSEFPPSAIKFRDICNKGPAIPRKPEETIAYSPPKMTEEAKRQAMAKLNELRKEMTGRSFS